MTDYRIKKGFTAKQPDTTKRKGGIAAPVRPYCRKEYSYNKPHYRAGGQNQGYENQPFGSMPRCCSSLRTIRFIQAAKESSPSACCACSIFSRNSGSKRNWNGGLPRLSILCVDTSITPHVMYLCVLTHYTLRTKKTTPRSAVTHAGRLTTNDS